MFNFIHKAYRYYFYRIYAFTLNNWKNKTIAHFTTTVLASAPIMFNVALLLVMLNQFFNIKIPTKETLINYVIAFAIIFVALNQFFISSNFNKLISEFKEGKKNNSKYNLRGWLITLYYIGSYLILFGVMLNGLENNKKRNITDTSKYPINNVTDSLEKDHLDSFIKAAPKKRF